MKLATGGLLVSLLIALCERGDSCSSISGPAGEFACVAISRYGGKQYASCLTNVYIQLKSGSKHGCELTTATYCYYQCMLETHSQNSGPVSSDCACEDSTGVTPTVFTGTTLPPYCYSPSGVDCTWYADCLERKFSCGSQTGYALTFGKKYCELYRAHYSMFARLTQQWVDAVRKCLQVSLVPLMRQFNHPTCDEVKATAISSHTGCYMSPAPGQPSICDVFSNNCADIFKIAFTIGGAFIETDPTVRYGTWTSFWQVLVSCNVEIFLCCLPPIPNPAILSACAARYLFEFVVESVRSGRTGRSVGSDEPGDTAVRFATALSDSLGWKALGIDWIPLTSNNTQTGGIEFKLLIGDQRVFNLDVNISQPIDMQAEMQKLKTKVQNGEAVFRLSDGSQYYARQLSECNNSNCSMVKSTTTSLVEPKLFEPKSAEVTQQRLGLPVMLLGSMMVYIARFASVSLR